MTLICGGAFLFGSIQAHTEILLTGMIRFIFQKVYIFRASYVNSVALTTPTTLRQLNYFIWRILFIERQELNNF